MRSVAAGSGWASRRSTPSRFSRATQAINTPAPSHRPKSKQANRRECMTNDSSRSVPAVRFCQIMWGSMALLAYRRVIPDFLHDLRHGARVIRFNPGYAAAAMLCLALGIGVNSTVFSLLDGMYFRLLPVPHADRIVAIDRDGGMPLFWRDYRAIRDHLRAFSGMAASQARGTFMDVARENFQIIAETVSVNYADILQLKPALGRWFMPADESPGAEPAVVISGHVWTAHFHRDPGALGQSVRIENQWYRVVGVAADEFRGTAPPVEVDAWVPLVTFPILRRQL